MDDFTGKTALVTGAASGIGRAVAEALAARGLARLIAADIDAEGLSALALPGCAVAALAGDVAEEALWADAPLAGLDLAVICAGISASGEIAGLDAAEWRRVMRTNLDGAFLALRAAMRAMGQRGGAIVLVSSATGIKAETATAAYGASKAAMLQLMRVAAKEGADRGIRVNAIAPAGVETPMWRSMDFFRDLADKTGGEEAAFAAMAQATPIGRFARAEEVAGQILFLLSAAAATITGATLVSDGGYLL